MAGINGLVTHRRGSAIGWGLLQSVWQVTLVAIMVAVNARAGKALSCERSIRNVRGGSHSDDRAVSPGWR